MEVSNTSALKARLLKLSDTWQNPDGQSVIYVMSRDQRVHDNHALIAAQKHAVALELPLVVVFCLYKKAGHRSREHFDFMMTGLRQVEDELQRLHIPFVLVIGPPKDRLRAVAHHYKPAAIYFDLNPLRGPQSLAKQISNEWPVILVDAHNIVPIWVTSSKQEYAARTIRPKIHKHLGEFLQEPDRVQVQAIRWPGPVMTMGELSNEVSEVLGALKANNCEVAFPSGEKAALVALDDFIQNRLPVYREARNTPSENGLSELSPYLHFGQLCSLRVMLRVTEAVQGDSSLQQSADTLLEEMIIRKELSDNFCYYNADYDTLNGAPQWALATLEKHAVDDREYLYAFEDFEHARTHDQAWNAAQRQLRKTGKIHGYMRMYWAKKVLEWSASPEEALKTLLYLNDFYSIDGGDPNGYVGILWSIAGLHDRPWGERAVYGTVRSMVYAGLKRKFDIAKYEKMWL